MQKSRCCDIHFISRDITSKICPYKIVAKYLHSNPSLYSFLLMEWPHFQLHKLAFSEVVDSVVYNFWWIAHRTVSQRFNSTLSLFALDRSVTFL